MGWGAGEEQHSLACGYSQCTASRPLTCTQLPTQASSSHSVPCQPFDIPQALFLKTADSVALPVYQVLPDAAQKIES